MDFSSTGYLKVRVYSAGGAIPIDGVSIRIKGTEAYNNGVDFTFLTDINGISKAIPLPAPDINYSLTPGASEQPYANYDIEIFKDGFYPIKLLNATVFPERTAVLPVELVPNAGLLSNTAPPFSSYPTLIYENEELE